MDEADGTALTERQRYWLEQIKACEALGKASPAELGGLPFVLETIICSLHSVANLSRRV